MYPTQFAEAPPAPAPLRPEPTTQSYAIAAGLVALQFVILIASFALSLFIPEMGMIAQAGLQYFPFAPLVVLAQIGERYLWARVVSYIYVVMLLGAITLVTIALVLAALVDPSDLSGAMTRPDTLGPIMILIVLLGLLFVVSSAVLLRPVRVFLDRWLPLNPDSFTHTMALWIAAYCILSAFAQLAFLGGRPPLLLAIQNQALPTDQLAVDQNLVLIFGLIWLIPLALTGAGWPIKRNFRDTMERLGLVKPTGRQVLFAVLGAFGLAIAVNIFSLLISQVWQLFGWPETDEETFSQLISGSINPLGALVIGFTAGLGEELSVRGLLQPRLGLLVSNLLFTSFHAYQYGLDALLVVFILGMILGVIRTRTNTTTSAILHGTYDWVLVMFSWIVTQLPGT